MEQEARLILHTQKSGNERGRTDEFDYIVDYNRRDMQRWLGRNFDTFYSGIHRYDVLRWRQ